MQPVPARRDDLHIPLVTSKMQTLLFPFLGGGEGDPEHFAVAQQTPQI